MKKILFVIIAVLLPAGYSFSQTVTTERSSSIVNIDGVSYYVHTVKQGETFFSLSRLYAVPEEDIKANNPHSVGGLNAGHTLKIPVARGKEQKLSGKKLTKIFDAHTIKQGETLYTISKWYEIPVNTLIEDNPGLDPTQLSIGQVINIRKKSKGDASPEEIEGQINDYSEAMNSVSDDVRYHVVKRGETIYGLSKMYGVSEDDIRNANDLSQGLRSGDMIKIPNPQGGTYVEAWTDGKPDDSWKKEKDPFYVPDTSRVENYNENIKVKPFNNIKAPNVALLLPLKSNNGSGDKKYLDFYHGALLALEDLKAEGVSARFELYNTPVSEAEMYKIVDNPSFEKTDIIIGPVYQECLVPVIEFAEERGVPVVSPLATFSGEDSPLIYQMAPVVSEKYSKLKELITPGKNIVYITTSYGDEEMDREIRPLLPANHRTVNYAGNVKTTNISDAIDKSADNLIFVSCTNELTLDQILATLSSAQNNLVARSITNSGITVVGTSRWNRFGKTLDKNLFFKLNVCYVSTYHADRSNDLVRSFDSRYISSFGDIPTLYSYRGYDSAKLAIGAAARSGGNYTDNMNEAGGMLLQTKYHFREMSPNTSFLNVEWPLVCYKSDYTIEIK